MAELILCKLVRVEPQSADFGLCKLVKVGPQLVDFESIQADSGCLAEFGSVEAGKGRVNWLTLGL